MWERIATGLIAAAAFTIPGSTAPAYAEAVVVPRSPVAAGTVLTALPPRWVVPVRGYRLTGRFGDSSALWRSQHTGLDLAVPSGTPIRSIGAGTVTAAGWDGRYGYTTVVRLGDGTEVWYSHQRAITVAVGDRVSTGQRIGSVGMTGNVTGPHLHLEIRPTADAPVDPLAWLRERGVRV